MADWQEQLNTILSDPDAMAQIVSIAQSISGGAPTEEKPPPGNAGGKRPVPPQDSAVAPDMEAIRGMLSGMDPELTSRLVALLGQMNRPQSGEAAALLLALKPFLSEKRRDKVERAAQLARFIHLAKLFFTSQGQEGGNV